MDFDDLYDVPIGDFIPGIYNYCDRWCERCLYTDRCRTFAMEKVFMRKLDKEKETIKPMIRMLIWMRMEVVKLFPNARNFVWPPKTL